MRYGILLLVTMLLPAAAWAQDAAKGRVALGELNCIACHAPSNAQQAWLSPKQAPKLNDISQRANGHWVAAFLASPQKTLPGTTMPNVLATLPEADRPAAAEALAHHLLSQSNGKYRTTYPDRAAATRGEALYHKVGCAACHPPLNGSAAAPGKMSPLPNLSEKWSFDGLRRFLRDPLAVRPSGRMPSLNLTDGEAADIAHYLLRDTKVPAAVEVTRLAGRISSFDEFDTAEPARTTPADGLDLTSMNRDRGFAVRLTSYLKIEKAGDYTMHLSAVGSARLAINDKWLIGGENWRREQTTGKATVRLEAGLHAIKIDFAQRGQKEPSLKVEWEAAGLPREIVPAGHLQAAKEEIRPQPAFSVDATKAAKGKQLYAQLNCAACHENKPAAPAVALSQLKPASGCLAETQTGKSPAYELDATARKDIAAALTELQSDKLAAPSAQQKLSHTMAALNCAACHVRQGMGGPVAGKDAHFTSNGEDLGEEGRLPPRLDDVGDKLRAPWMLKVLTQAAAVRPYMNTRMPQYGTPNVEHLPDLFVAIDQKPEKLPAVADALDAQREAGRKLTGTEGLSCIACHRFNRQPALTMQVVDLTTAGERLNEPWFRRFLLDPNKYHPGTRMPAFWPEGRSLLPAILEGNTTRQHAALWTYFADGSLAKFPVGLSRQNVELVVGGEAVVYRGKLWEAGFRALAVGHPGGLNQAFDAEELRLALLWRGRFLNAGPHWNVQGMGQIRPLGTEVVVFPKGSAMAVLPDAKANWPKESARELGMRFRGYQLDSFNRPAILYSFGDTPIEDHTARYEQVNAQTGLLRTITFQKPPPQGLHVRLAVGSLKSVGPNAWRLNDVLTIKVKGATAIVRGEGDGQELLVPAAFGGKIGAVEVDYAW